MDTYNEGFFYGEEETVEYAYGEPDCEDSLSYALSAIADDDDKEEEEEEEEQEREDARKDWGEVDPLDSPNQPWTPMDPTGPGSAV